MAVCSRLWDRAGKWEGGLKVNTVGGGKLYSSVEQYQLRLILDLYGFVSYLEYMLTLPYKQNYKQLSLTCQSQWVRSPRGWLGTTCECL